jgi:hypothetical protein
MKTKQMAVLPGSELQSKGMDSRENTQLRKIKYYAQQTQ